MEIKRLSVSDFNKLIEIQLGTLGEFNVVGEITQINISQRGGVNIVVKDPNENAILHLSGYKPRISGIDLVKEGMKISTWGTPQMWSPAGKFSLSIHKIIPQGEGLLKAAYEKLKTKLYHEGLFEEERKRDIPDFITQVALITGRDSAAYSDFVKILKENCQNIQVDYYPVHVQGKYAESEIISTLKYCNKQSYDCVVLTRGGGSLEDLIAFNDELLAREVFSSKNPVIAGVGHEKDESIADFVADLRASTPSQAAYYIIEKNSQFIQNLNADMDEIHRILSQKIGILSSEISSSLKGVDLRIYAFLQSAREKRKMLLMHLENFTHLVSNTLEKTISYEKMFNSYNPHTILKKGFSITRDEHGKIISSARQIKIGDKFKVQLRKGILTGKASKIDLNSSNKYHERY